MSLSVVLKSGTDILRVLNELSDSDLDGTFDSSSDEFVPNPKEHGSSDSEDVGEGDEDAHASAAGDQAPANTPAKTVFYRQGASFCPPQLVPEAVEADDGQGYSAISIKTPMEYFAQFAPTSMFAHIAEKSNQDSVQKTGKSLLITKGECMQFMGATMMMSVLKLPWMKLYWSTKTRIAAIADAISRNRFHQIRGHLKAVCDHDVPQEQRERDRLWKVRPVLESVLAGCLAIPRPPVVCIDEQMIPFTGKTILKQYVPCKPNPEGIKNYVLATPEGLVLDFEPYQGKKLCDEEQQGKPWSLPESVVLRLIQSLPRGTSIYFDRYFTSTRLLDHLRVSKCMSGTGTIRKVSIPKDAKLPSEKELKKKERGTSVTSVRNDGGLAITVWQDNKPVYMASTEHGSDPEDLVKRYSRKERRYIEIKRPDVIRAYNKNMGGVDLNDRMVAHYRSGARTSKWTVKTMLHFLDLAAVNAWILYKKDCQLLGRPASGPMKMLEFKYRLAEQLLAGDASSNSGSSSASNTGSGDESDKDGNQEAQGRKRRRLVTPLPSPSTRTYGKHLPVAHQRVEFKRCRLAECRKLTGTECSRCKIFLCCLPSRNCYYKFHSQKDQKN